MRNAADPVARHLLPAAVGGAEFLSTPERLERCRLLAQQGYLVARVPNVADPSESQKGEAERLLVGPPSGRDGLGARLHAAIEQALAQRGAPPSALGADADEHARAYDQLGRSRTVDAPGICLLMPSIRLAAVDGALSASDSSVLRAWRAVSMLERVVLLFEEADGPMAMLYPQALCAVFACQPPARAAHDEIPTGAFVAPDSGLVGPGACDRAVESASLALTSEPVEAAGQHMDVIASDPLGGYSALTDGALGLLDNAEFGAIDALRDGGRTADNLEEPRSADPLARQHAATLGLLFEALLVEPSDEPAAFLLEPAPDSDALTLRADSLVDEGSADPGQRLTLHSVEALDAEPSDALPHQPELPEGSVFDSPSSPPPGMAEIWAPGRSTPPARLGAARSAEPGVASDDARARPSSRPAPRGRRRPPARKDTSRLGRAIRLDHETCSRFARELDASHGPQPVRTVEQLYRTRYAPLLETLSAGLEHEPARQALKGWRQTFSKSYGDGFTAIKLTGKRPPMVFDAPELAARVARMHGAKGVELLLVDGMRLDLAQRAGRLIGARVGARAVCVDETLLWSALPTVTPVQLKLLARGPGALKDIEATNDSDALVHRERSATTLRRLRLGSRDLLKLDVVEARLREAGGAFDERLADLADLVADAAVELIATMPAGSLLYLFGDHGFRLPAGGADDGAHENDSTPPASQGGPSPEEVLTPASAWLVGHGSDAAN